MKSKTPTRKVPKVRIAAPEGRPLQLRYTCPVEGREIRISTNTYDQKEAEDQRDKLAAKLVLGIDAKPARRFTNSDRMSWEQFRDSFTRLKAATFRSENSRESAEYRLDVCEKVIDPRTLADMAKPSTLARLQAELLAGAGSPRNQPRKKKEGEESVVQKLPQQKPRSAHTVRSYMMTLIAALNWAHGMKWLPERVDFAKMDADEPDKGRPLCGEEFDRLIAAVPKVVTEDGDVAGWRYLLRGLWESGLRLTEAMMVSWDDDNAITPVFPKKGLPHLHIPAKMQKSRKAQDAPTTPAFAALLKETSEGDRKGWIFNPGARRGAGRLTPEQAGRIITAIGKAANIVVNAAGKTASAHDLRRSFGQRMADAGLPSRDLQAIMRHASVTTTEAYYLRDRVQDQAKRIAMYLGTSARMTAAKAADDFDANHCHETSTRGGT
jgi:integrase